MSKKQTLDMTRGNPLRLLIRFAIPLILGSLFQQLYSFVDTAIVGRCIGSDALTAVGVTGSLNFLVLGFTMGSAMGFCIPISQSVGAGEKEESLRALARELGIENSVRFLGSRGDMAELYQAMDVFVMPSLYEGVPVVGIEAQLAGLPCLFSDRIPTEVCFTDQCRFIPLESGEAGWVEEILSASRMLRATPENGYRKYNARDAAAELAQCYETLWEGGTV